MQFKERTYNALVRLINGEQVNPQLGILLPYKSGPDLVRFFNELGSDDFYGSGFGSRASYTDGKLRQLASVQEFSTLINLLMNPINNIEEQSDYQAVMDYLNPYLRFDDLEIYAYLGKYGTEYAVRSLSNNIVEFDLKEKQHHPLSHEYITEQVEKCDKKLSQSDHSGVITNARTLIEEVLKAIQAKLDPSPKDTGGDLIKLYKEVQRLLNLDPANQPVEPLKQLLNGLTSIVNGVSALRNNSGDAHARRFKPMHHHARLAVNAAKTLCDFLFDTFEYQHQKGFIQLVDESTIETAEVS